MKSGRRDGLHQDGARIDGVLGMLTRRLRPDDLRLNVSIDFKDEGQKRESEFAPAEE